MRPALALALAGCGRIGFVDLPAGDGATDTSVVDRPLDATATGPFGTPVLVGPLANAADDDDVTLPGDQLELYYETKRFGSQGIAVSTRANLAAAWSAPTLVNAFTSASTEASPEISGDGLTMMFSSDRPGGLGTYDIYVAKRTSRAAAWSLPMIVPELNSAGEDISPVLSASGLEVVLHSTRAGGPGGRDLYLSSRASLGVMWSAPVRISELNSADDDASPFFTAGDLELWFASAKPGGAGGRDIYIARRAAIGAPFTSVTPLAELNTAFDDDDVWLSPDGHTLYMGSSRSGNPEIYVSTR